MAANIESKSVKEIFENMEYGSVTESFDLAKAWIEKHGLKIPKAGEEIETTIQNSEKQSKAWAAVSAADRSKLLNKLIAEIERHSTLICQIELFTRQVLTKDTKTKSITLLNDYLRYYAGWTYVIEKHLTDYKPYGLCAAYLDDATPLAILGAILAPVLATGNTIILGVSASLIPISCLIAELCKNVGFPAGIISIIDVPNFEILMTHKQIKKLTFIGNLHDTSIVNIHATSEKYLTTLHLGKSSVLVFDTADLDSAIDCIIESAWTYRGMFPCGINKLYVQESIFKEFIKRIKNKISKLNIGYPEDATEKTFDVIIANETLADNIKVDIINKIPLQIGHKTFGSNILSDDQNNNILSILAFRTANEAVALSNNIKFGFATSIWTENISLANEVSSKLKSSIVWVNTHGYINSNTAFSPIKGSGQGYFGGKEGLLEYMTYSKSVDTKPTVPKTVPLDSHLPRPTNNKRTSVYFGGSFKKSESGLLDGDHEFLNKKDIRNCVEIAKKSYEIWSKIQLKTRRQHLLKLADVSESFKIKNATLTEKWIEYLREWAMLYDSVDSLFQKGNTELKVTKEPLGIIAIDVHSDQSLKLIISALISGNSIILVNYADDMEEFLLELCKIIPSSGITSGVFNAVFNSTADIVNTLLTHREINAYFTIKTEQVTFKQLQTMKHIKNVNVNSFDNLKLVTNNKCIWTSVGESFL